MYNIWQDAGIRTRVAATAAKCATNELHSTHIPNFSIGRFDAAVCTHSTHILLTFTQTPEGNISITTQES